LVRVLALVVLLLHGSAGDTSVLAVKQNQGQSPWLSQVEGVCWLAGLLFTYFGVREICYAAKSPMEYRFTPKLKPEEDALKFPMTQLIAIESRPHSSADANTTALYRLHQVVEGNAVSRAREDQPDCGECMPGAVEKRGQSMEVRDASCGLLPRAATNSKYSIHGREVAVGWLAGVDLGRYAVAVVRDSVGSCRRSP